jgi:hypothetical protein
MRSNATSSVGNRPWASSDRQALERSLHSPRATRPEGEPRLPADWKALNSDYERRFGIAPEQATAPPQG